MISCELADLMNAAKCFSKLSNQDNSRISAYLLCQISNSGGETFFRITEAGDRRITESGDPRIIE